LIVNTQWNLFKFETNEGKWLRSRQLDDKLYRLSFDGLELTISDNELEEIPSKRNDLRKPKTSEERETTYKLHSRACDFYVYKNNVAIIYEDGLVLVHDIFRSKMKIQACTKIDADCNARVAMNNFNLYLYTNRNIYLYNLN
jgi:hypothetical protein